MDLILIVMWSVAGGIYISKGDYLSSIGAVIFVMVHTRNLTIGA